MTMIGQVLNHRYEILEKIGEGGMATAYRGRDRVLGRVVAIKVMRPELAADAEFLSRFRREARAAAGITHEHIAGVYDTGNDGINHYIVMEYVEGESLRDRLRREGPLPLGEALRIATETASALEAAHAAGIIHRDIKPHNILLGREGRVKVTDFGIARAMAASGHTDTGRIFGSVNYVSPEQARGEAVGPQADVYSLGVTLFEMLAGRPPFEGNDRLAVLHKHIYDRPPLVSTFRKGLPAEAESVVDHALEKDLGRRFASVREFANYLIACPHGEAARAGTGPSRRRSLARRWETFRWQVRRHAVLASLVVLLAAGGLVGAGLFGLVAGGRGVQTPDLVGVSQDAAKMQAEGAGFVYREVGSRPSDDVAAGSILSQEPCARQRVPAGSVLKVVVSQGSDEVVVPDVSEMTRQTAELHLKQAMLTIGRRRENYDDHVPKGYVRATYPAKGTKVVKGVAVDIEISWGPKPLLTPTPPVPAAPNPSGRPEKVNYRVPSDAGDKDTALKVTADLVDENGVSVSLYEGQLKPGEAIPPVPFVVSKPVTLQIAVNGIIRWQESYKP